MPKATAACSFLALVAAAAGAAIHLRDTATSSGNHVWGLSKFTSLVAFGDSYTDETRLSYFGSHNGSAPPVGWVEPENLDAADGGRVWPRYLVQYAGINLYNYAVSGAVCSNELTPRIYAGINAPFPSVKDYEVPAFIADSQYVEPNGTKFETLPVDETVYSMWIGTNDVGVWGFLTDSQVKGITLVNYVNCVFNQLDKLYATGARYFVLMNMAPLNLAALYGDPADGGVGDNGYWPTKDNWNLTEVYERMTETVATVNALYESYLPFQVVVQNRYPGAHFALYDVHELFEDIHNHPQNFLNGTAPLNVTGFIQHCNLQRADCSRLPSPDSFLWFDELHPSEQTERLVAQNFLDVVNGSSKYATYWS